MDTTSALRGSGLETTFVSKHDKYRSRNPISRWLVANFLKTLENTITPLNVNSILDVGCGEGLVLKSLEHKVRALRCAAIDIDPVEVVDAANNLPWCRVEVGSAYHIPHPTGGFDLVMCSEVLEHLEHPTRALDEICRVSAKYVLLSVPREPIWRILNVLRGSYLHTWGNTPGHIRHWTASTFEAFVNTRLSVQTRLAPFPFTLVVGTVR